MDVQFIKHTAAGKSLFQQRYYCPTENVIEHENVSDNRGEFQLDGFQAKYRTLKATIHTDQLGEPKN